MMREGLINMIHCPRCGTPLPLDDAQGQGQFTIIHRACGWAGYVSPRMGSLVEVPYGQAVCVWQPDASKVDQAVLSSPKAEASPGSDDGDGLYAV